MPALKLRQGRLVHYPSAVGPLAALLTAVPSEGRRHPSIVWITGGDANTIDGSVWEAAVLDNDQTARQYREATFVTFYPSLRGGNNNSGYREGFFGKVDDVLAAADWLAVQSGIDPQRIYLGGHSTGATLVLLVAEASTRFRAVFAFGSAADPAEHQRGNVPLDPANGHEMALRRPIAWLDGVHSAAPLGRRVQPGQQRGRPEGAPAHDPQSTGLLPRHVLRGPFQRARTDEPSDRTQDPAGHRATSDITFTTEELDRPPRG